MRNKATVPVLIGNGLYAQTRREESLWKEYRRKQRECEHRKRDPRGMCYECGDRKETENVAMPKL